MTLPELRALMRKFLAYDLDNFEGEEPTDAELDAQINRSLRLMSREMFLVDPRVGLRLKAGEPIVNYQDPEQVTKRVVRPFTVTVSGNKLRGSGGEYGLWGWEEFIDQNSTWESATTGTPSKAVFFGSRQLILHLPPSQAVADLTTHYICGQVVCNDLTGIRPLDDPARQGFPIEFHEDLAYLASRFAALPNVTEQEGFTRLEAYDREWKPRALAIRNENYRLFHSGDRPHSDYADYILL